MVSYHHDHQLRHAPFGATPAIKTTLLSILAAAWQTAESGTSGTNAGAINVFIRFAFDGALLQDLDHEGSSNCISSKSLFFRSSQDFGVLVGVFKIVVGFSVK